MRLIASDFIDYYRPSKCALRVFLKQKGEKEREPGIFEDVLRRLGLTSPSFCTTASERVYITTSSDNANGGSQGAVGDRRAAICGANVAGAGAL